MAVKVGAGWTDQQLHELRLKLDQQVLDRVRVRFHPKHLLVIRDQHGVVQRVEIDWVALVAILEPHLG